MTDLTLWLVVLAGLVSAVVTGLGAAPFLFVPHGASQRWIGIANALAAGVMMAVSIALIVEGVGHGWATTMLGMAAGVAAIAGADKLLDRTGAPGIANLEGADAIKALLVVAVMFLHSFAEGVAIGVSFGGGQALGLVIAVAITLHNIPQGMAVALVMVPHGTSVGRAAWWAIVTSLPQPALAIPAFLFVLVFEPFLPFGFGFAGGAMIWVCLAELLPDADEGVGRKTAASYATAALVAMLALQLGVLAVTG